MNAGNVAGILVLIGGFIFAKKYSNRRFKREVKVIDNISYPIYDARNRTAASTRSIKTSGDTKRSRVKAKVETRRGIQIPNNSSGTGGEQTKRKDSNSIELHKPTAL